jgi:hypothetical protein
MSVGLHLNGQHTISFGGAGYESYNLAYTQKLGCNSYQISVGVKPPLQILTGNYAFSAAVFWDKTGKFAGPRWPLYLVNRFTYWEKDNLNYNWKVLTTGIGVGGKFFIFKKSGIYYEVAPVISLVLNYERKTYDKIGWPKLFNIDYGIGIFKQF